MRYYLFRQSPNMNTIITSAEAMEWDVIMILKTMSLQVTPGLLYQSYLAGFVYVHEVEQYAYDMMDALDFPQANRKDFAIVVPQEVFTPTSHSTIAYDRIASSSQSTKIFIHTIQTVGKYRGTAAGMRLHKRMG